MVKESSHQEDIAILNVYAPNNRAIKYVKQTVMELTTIIVGDFNTPLSIIDRAIRQNIRARRARI